jgi:hypothetical protein
MRGAFTSTPQYAFMAWCLVKAQGQLLSKIIQQSLLLFGRNVCKVTSTLAQTLF